MAQCQACSGLKFLLTLEQDFAIVDAPRKIHEPVHIQQLLRGQSFVSIFHRAR